MSIILASGSPRRKELLEMLGVKDMKIIPAKGEEVAPAGLTPGELVMALAAHKGREVAGTARRGTFLSPRIPSSGTTARCSESRTQSSRPPKCSVSSPAKRTRCIPACAS